MKLKFRYYLNLVNRKRFNFYVKTPTKLETSPIQRYKILKKWKHKIFYIYFTN